MKFALSTLKLATAAVLAATATGALAQKGETVKIAWLDPLSGLMAAVGTNQLKTTQFLAEEFNKKNASGVKFEIIAIDNKLSPQETTAALRSAQDQGARYITQGNGSGPALAIIDAVEKNNARNPGKELLKFYEGKTAKWQIPDDVVFVEAIPLGATGKILKTKLRELLKDYKLPTA